MEEFAFAPGTAVPYELRRATANLAAWERETPTRPISSPVSGRTQTSREEGK